MQMVFQQLKFVFLCTSIIFHIMHAEEALDYVIIFQIGLFLPFEVHFP